MSSSMRVRAIAEARRLDRDAREGAAELVDDERREGLTLDVPAMIMQGRPDWITCSSTGSTSPDRARSSSSRSGCRDPRDRFHPLWQ